jgi:hypothetical protein
MSEVETGLSIKPAAMLLEKGAEQQFTAYRGEEKIAHSQVEWELSGGKGKTTLENGLLKVAVTETAEILTVTVKAEISGKQAQAQTKVMIMDNVMSHEEHGLIVSPATVDVPKGFTKTFIAMLSESGEAASGVEWEVIGGEASIIYSDGSYSCELTVGADETATKLMVLAALADDNDKYGTAVVTVLLSEEEANINEWSVTDAAGFAGAIAKINSKEEGEYMITLANNIYLDDAVVFTEAKTSKTITIKAYSTPRTLYNYSNDVLFTVNDNTTLVLEKNVTLSSNAGYLGNRTVSVEGGELIMKDGSAIEGHGPEKYGGGVYISNGTFTMKGGKISGNTSPYGFGGGVYIDSDGTFTMEDGEISGNTAYYGGGGVYSNGTFTMKGGKISGNMAHNDGQNLDSSGGGGVYIYTGIFTMTGGYISGNSAAKSYYGGGHGGGVAVYNYGTFTMTGGYISGNSTNGYGGGVWVYSSTSKFIKEGGTIYGSNEGYASNTAITSGDAAYVKGLENSYKRDATAGPTDNLNSRKTEENGGWDNE